jgi:hypothetical protein
MRTNNLVEQAQLVEFETVGSPSQSPRFVEFQWKVGLRKAFTDFSLVPPALRTAPFQISHKDFKTFISKNYIASYKTANNIGACKRHNTSLKASAAFKPTSFSMVRPTFKHEVSD